MEIRELQAEIEAILFAAGDPISVDKIAEAIGLSVTDTDKLIAEMIDKSCEDGRGIEIVKMNSKYQLCTKKKYASFVRTILEIRRNTPLSQPAMEILSIIAYNQPVTKGFVEQIRGVDSSGVIATLVQKGLIEEKGRLEVPGRPLLFGTTDLFLRCFQISSLSELPPIQDETLVNETEEETEEEK